MEEVSLSNASPKPTANNSTGKVTEYVKNPKIWIGGSILLILIGIIMLCCTNQAGEVLTIDYTNCTNEDKQVCAERIQLFPNNLCMCVVSINVTTPMPNALLSYELPTFDQKQYENSKDVNQLAGVLSLNVSHSCAPYDYDASGKPIAPCGALADFRFTDTFSLVLDIDKSPDVEFSKVDLVPKVEISKYHNPPGDLKVAFKDFAQPTSWSVPVWKLDEDHQNNNGLQNIDFIVWMDTNLKRKPFGRVVHKTPYFENGLAPNKYVLLVAYKYSPLRYSGQRLAVIESPSVTNTALLAFGIIFLLIGIVLLTYSTLKLRNISISDLLKRGRK